MYYYRREDNGELVTVPYSEAIRQDIAGYIAIGGVPAKRVHSKDPVDSTEKSKPTAAHKDRPIISDTLGFGQHQLADFEADRKANGFNGVEFVRDPTVPEFFQVKIDSQKEWGKYVKHRGMFDKNSMNGSSVMLTEKDFEDAKKLALR